MGICSSSKKKQIQKITPVLQLQYSRQALIKIRTQCEQEKSPANIEIPFNLSEPIKSFSEEIILHPYRFQLSFSILPGLNPMNDTEKECQDNCFGIFSQSAVFIGLYDGHGDNGGKVVEFCSEFAQSLFSSFENYVNTI